MAQISGTFEFQSVENDELILESFERIGIPGDQLTPVYINSAVRSINFILLEWMNKTVNLWTVNRLYLSLNEGQNNYILGTSIIDIRSAHLRTFTRNLGGVAQSNTGDTYDGGGGGNAASAFDGDIGTRCTQNVQNGNISYDYGVGKTNRINFIGVQSYVSNRPYSLVLEASQDTVTWFTVPTTITPVYNYQKDVVAWFDVIAPVNARSYRIRETGGYTLDLEEIYFCNNTNDLAITSVSEDTYESFSNKNSISRPTCYFFDKKLEPKLYLYPSPSKSFQVLRYSFVRNMYDAGKFFHTPAIPAKMYPAMVSGLTWRLAVKYKPEVADSFKMVYDQDLSEAISMDSEHVDITVSYDLSKYDVR
jgi:hypothetical protein